MLVGREKEKEILLKALHSDEAEMVAIIGRRRVGKTFLVRAVYSQHLLFEITGLEHASPQVQLNNFYIHLKTTFGENIPPEKPTDWLEAFYLLVSSCKKLLTPHQKKVIFLDELPWLAVEKNNFFHGLSFFWNSWAVKNNIVVVVCGSAASWMIENLVHNKGGLYNRITRRVYLLPFNLYETKAFLAQKNVYLDNYQISQIYMAVGGVPHYLKEVEAGKSAVQNISQMCFSHTGLLYDEFERLYISLFDNYSQHLLIIKALAQKWKGLTRQELVTATALADDNNLTRYLEELIHSGFVASYHAFGKKQKDILYRVTDEYTLFNLHFMQKNKPFPNDIWQLISQTQEFKAWSGYAFENVCLKHIDQIKKGLGISGLYAEASSFYHKGDNNTQGVQIDLLIDRNDNVINIFELKFYNEPFSITKSYSEDLKTKVTTFKALTKTRKQIFLNMLTSYGLKANKYSISLISSSMDINVLFEK